MFVGVPDAVADPDKSLAYFSTVEEAKVPQGKTVTATTPAAVTDAIASKAPTAVYYYQESCGKCRLVSFRCLGREQPLPRALDTGTSLPLVARDRGLLLSGGGGSVVRSVSVRECDRA